MKKPFKPGDRVRIFGHKSAPGWEPIDGMVCEPPRNSPDGNCRSGMTLAVDCGVNGIFYAHPKQCRKLKPRKPKSEGKEGRRLWTTTQDLQKPDGTGSFQKFPPTETSKISYDWLEFIEAKPNAVQVTEAELARAWDSHLYKAGSGTAVCDAKSSLAFENFCRALGIPPSTEAK